MSTSFLSRTLSILGLSAMLAFAGSAAMAQEVTTCEGVPGNYVKLVNQQYALCAGAETVNFDEVTYAKCKIMRGTSISAELKYPFPTDETINSIPNSGNIATVNRRVPGGKGYIVSTYTPPAGVYSPRRDLALYTCDQGSYAQCDGGLCFTSTTGKSSPLWGKVKNNEIICSCPVTTTSTPFQIFGPGTCPTTAAEYDKVCAKNVTAAVNGAILYIGSPAGGPQALAACLGQSTTFNTCTRPAN